jgi:hypothetical protein
MLIKCPRAGERLLRRFARKSAAGKSLLRSIVAIPLLFGIAVPGAWAESSLQWGMVHKKDKLSDAVTTLARAYSDIEGGGYFVLEASCLSLDMPLFGNTTGLAITFDYYNDHTPPSFVWTTFNGEKFVGVRSRLGNDDVVATKSETDYVNEAVIAFTSTSNREPNGGPAPLGVFGGMIQNTMLTQGLAAGTIGDFFDSERLRVELPLDDGRTPVVEISTTDPVFRTIMSSCVHP